MKRSGAQGANLGLCLLLAVAALGGTACGPELAGGAAASAAAEAAQLEKARQQKAEVEAQVQAIVEKQQQERIDTIDKQVERDTR